MWKAAMIPINRGGRPRAINAMMARARLELRRGRQIIIFPEGTRRPPGRPRRTNMGWGAFTPSPGCPVLPIALNSGLFWPRRSFRRIPGTVTVEFLDVIGPGLTADVFLERLKTEIEGASARLIAEASADPEPPAASPNRSQQQARR